MKFDHIIHTNVNPEDGTFTDGRPGAVMTGGDFLIDQVGKMIWIAAPINEQNEVHVNRIIFDSNDELTKVLNQMHFYYK